MGLTLKKRARTTIKYKSDDILSGSLLKGIVLFAIPLAASSIFQQLFNAVDTAVVGRFAGRQAMAAVGSNSALIHLLLAIFIGLSIGSNVLIARFIGMGEKEKVSEAVHTSVTLALVSGIFLLIAGQFVARRMLLLMGSPEDVIDLATVYLKIYFLGAPAIMIYNFVSAILRSVGDSKRPMIAVVIAGILNVILNLILVIVFRLSVVGVSIATTISNYVSALYLINVLRNDEDLLKLEASKLGINISFLRDIMRVGIPAGIQGMVFSLANTVIQSSVNSFGSAAVAGSAAAFNYEIIGYYSANAFSQAAVTYTSQNYAAGNEKRCRSIYWISTLVSLASVLAFDITVTLFRGFFLRLFSTDPAVLEFADRRILCVLIFHWMICSYEIASSCLRGRGHSMLPTALMIMGTCVFRIMWVVVFLPFHRSFDTLMIVYPLSWLITGTLVVGAYFISLKRSRGSMPR